jgi:hypothetical protein
MLTVTSEPIHARPHYKMCAKFLGETVELIDVAFAIADMDTPAWPREPFNRLTKIIKPPNAFFLLDWHTGRVNLALERRRTLELVAIPELHCRKTKWKPFRCYRQAGMHQDPAKGVMAKTPFLVPSAVDALGEPYGMRATALIGELGRVLQEQNRPVAGVITRPGRSEVPAQNIALLDLGVREEPIGGLRIRPILASERNGAPHRVAKSP